MNPTQQKLIDSYLRDELSGSERSSFERLMESDPAFREEVRFEEYVKEGIGRFRKAQLKSRLDAIEVSTGWVGAGQFGSGAVKTVGAFLAAAIIGTAGYFLLDVPAEEAIDNSNEIISEDLFPKKNGLPEIVVPEIAEAGHEPEEEKGAEVLKEESVKVTEYKPSPATEINEVDETVTEEEFVPNVAVPGLNGMETEEAFASGEVDMPEVSATDEINPGLEPLDVKTIHRRSESIKYKYFEGKLYLYGDFKNQHYEILEIYGTSDRKIYVYFMSDYYNVEVTDKVVELPKITNDKQIRELEIIRNNKLTD